MLTFDFETHLLDLPISKTKPVLAAMGDTQTKIEIFSAGDAIDRIIDSRESWSGWNVAFDALLVFPHAPQVVIQKYADKQVFDAMLADKILAIRDGSYRRRRFSLGESSWYWLRENLDSDKYGSDELKKLFTAKKNTKAAEKRDRLISALKNAAKTLEPEALEHLDEVLEELHTSWEDIPWRYKYGFLDGVRPSDLPKEATRYVKDDVWFSQTLGDTFRDIAKKERYVDSDGWPRTTSDESTYAFGLQLTAEVGFFARQSYLATLQKQAKSTVDTLAPLLSAEELIKIRTTGPHKGTWGMNQKNVQKMVEEEYLAAGIEPPRTDTGAPRRDAETLDQCPGKRAALFREWVKASRFLDVEYPMLSKGRVLYTAFDSMLVTGRVASRNTGLGQINSLNLKKKGGILEAFEPPTIEEAKEIHARLGLRFPSLPAGDRYVILDADYAQLELFTAALRFVFDATGKLEYVPGVSPLADTLMQGLDVHSMIASADLGVRYSDFRVSYEAGEAEAKKHRQLAKPVIYGALGMMGARRMALTAFQQGTKMAVLPNGLWDYEESVRVAERLLEACYHMFPDIRKYRRSFQHTGGDGINAFALPSFTVRGGCSPSEAGNYAIQAPAAKITKRALFWLWYLIVTGAKGHPLEGALPFMYVHDQIRLYVPRSKITIAAKVLKEVMTKSKEQEVPFITGKDAEPAASTLVTKDLDPIWKNGELQVVEVPTEVPSFEFPWQDQEPVNWLYSE